MKKNNTLIGIVTFGNLEFTRLAVRGIRETTQRADILIVIGKPGDFATMHYCEAERIPFILHTVNHGFPASINDIYDYAWNLASSNLPDRAGQPPGHEPYEFLAIMGNDVIPYPGAIDALIDAAETTDYEWFCSSQFDARSLVERYPEARQYFHGDTLIFIEFESRPWELHKDFRNPFIEPDTLKDVHNLALYKKSVFDKIGYIDVNFFPAYFSDNDYAVRAVLAGVKACGLPHSAYFHFWSRTIHQGSGGSTDKHFSENQNYYVEKWGGLINKEKFKVPFNGQSPDSFLPIVLPASLNIQSRTDEGALLNKWRG